MKTTFTLAFAILLAFFQTQVIAQNCIADAGPDTILCSTDPNVLNHTLGGSPAASGGVGGYTYLWEMTWNLPGGFTWTASDFLDDTTSANPQFTSHPEHGMVFYLTVTDSVGTQCTDSVTIGYSNWNWTLVYHISFLNQGDSTQLQVNAGGGIPPYTYSWSPTNGLDDPTVLHPWAKPNVTTIYTITITDSIGCQASSNHDVIIYPTSVHEYAQALPELLVYPQPMVEQTNLDLKPEWVGGKLLIYDVQGRQIAEKLVESTRIPLTKSDLPKSGIYYFGVRANDQPVGYGRVVVQ